MYSKYETLEGIWLERLSWVEAETLFKQDRIVVIPLGAAAKEHGPHLPLNNDALIAQWLAEEVAQALPVIIAPPVNASFYPAFVEYPGSISLRFETARDLLVDICSSLAAQGAKRFYVLNTGVSTEAPLAQARTLLSQQDIRFEYLQLGTALQSMPSGLLKQSRGGHADEHETSLMLHIAPQVVDMDKAVDDGATGDGHLSRVEGVGIYTPSGVYGQATLATAEKGRAVATALLDQVLQDIGKMF